MKTLSALAKPVSACLLLLLSACSDGTEIQRVYDDARDDCRGTAERNARKGPQGAQSEKDYNAQLTSLFSDCMFTNGWTVATAPHPGGGGGGDGEGVGGGGGKVASNNDWGTSPQHPEILASSRSAAAKKAPAPQAVPQSAVPAANGAMVVAPVPVNNRSAAQQPGTTAGGTYQPQADQSSLSNGGYRMDRQSLSRSAATYGNTRGSSGN